MAQPPDPVQKKKRETTYTMLLQLCTTRAQPCLQSGATQAAFVTFSFLLQPQQARREPPAPGPGVSVLLHLHSRGRWDALFAVAAALQTVCLPRGTANAFLGSVPKASVPQQLPPGASARTNCCRLGVGRRSWGPPGGTGGLGRDGAGSLGLLAAGARGFMGL